MLAYILFSAGGRATHIVCTHTARPRHHLISICGAGHLINGVSQTPFQPDLIAWLMCMHAGETKDHHAMPPTAIPVSQRGYLSGKQRLGMHEMNIYHLAPLVSVYISSCTSVDCYLNQPNQPARR